MLHRVVSKGNLQLVEELSEYKIRIVRCVLTFGGIISGKGG